MCIAEISRPCNAVRPPAGAKAAPAEPPACQEAALANHVAGLIGAVLEQAVAASERMKKPAPTAPSPYQASEVPQVPLAQYLQRWVKYTGCSAGTLVCAAVYVDRMVLGTGLPLSALVIHRLLLCALLVATKWTHDRVCTNSLFAGIGGVTRDELNALEGRFLNDLQWNTFVDRSLYEAYLTRLQALVGRH